MNMKKPHKINIRVLKLFIAIIGFMFGFVNQIVAQYGAPSASYTIKGKLTDCYTKEEVPDYLINYTLTSYSSFGNKRVTRTDSLGNLYIWFDLDVGQSPGKIIIEGDKIKKETIDLETPKTWASYSHEVLLEVCDKKKKKSVDEIDEEDNFQDTVKNYNPEPEPIIVSPQPEKPKVIVFDDSKEFIYLKPKHSWPSELQKYLEDPYYIPRAIGTFAYTLDENKKEFFIENVDELRLKFPKQFEEAFPGWDYVVEKCRKFK